MSTPSELSNSLTSALAERQNSNPLSGIRVGIDIAQISGIASSIESFGERFTRRLFTDAEVAYAEQVPALTTQRLAARFAAKEAAIKAFGLAGEGFDWRDIEVRRASNGSCTLALHGRVAASAKRIGLAPAAISLSHDGDYAMAVVLSSSIA